MQNPEKELLTVLKQAGVNFTASLPCEKIKVLLEMVEESFFHVPLTREEEGVGICAGAALSGKRPAMFIQSSGIGNMINALLSLTSFYRLPLALFVSQRGIYKERIAAQLPMGQRLPAILKGSGIPCSLIGTSKDFKLIQKKLPNLYRQGGIHAFLLSPAIWEDSEAKSRHDAERSLEPTCGYPPEAVFHREKRSIAERRLKPKFKRYEILQIISPYLKSKAVVCNLGFPSKELYASSHCPSYFYMLGSMGMATPIGLGVSLTNTKEVVVIDGDGSLLMNPGTLATAANFGPANLTIFAVDNGSYGSTGGQPTLARSCVDLEAVARGFGIRDTLKVSTKKQLIEALKKSGKGLRFIHALALPGNEKIPNIPIGHIEIKRQFAAFLKSLPRKGPRGKT